MSFGENGSAPINREHGEDPHSLEAQARNGLINVQNSIRSLGDQISRLSQSQPTPTTISIMNSLLSESSSTTLTVETQLRQWKKSSCSDPASAARKKLVLPPLEASLNTEVEKLKRFKRLVDTSEKQLKSANGIDSFTLCGHSDEDDVTGLAANRMDLLASSNSMNRLELTDIAQESFEAKARQPFATDPSGNDYSASNGQLPPMMLPVVNSSLSVREQLSRSQQQVFSSNPIEFSAPVLVGGHFYDNADDDEDRSCRIHKSAVSLSSSTMTGRSGSPTSEEEDDRHGCHENGSSTPLSDNRLCIPASHSQASDNFLEDDYLSRCYRNQPKGAELGETTHNEYYDNDDDVQEFSGLLSRGSKQSASYFDGWHLTVDEPRQDDDLELYVSRERLRGVRRIKAQLSQISHVFKELAHLINEQQDDLDLIDSNVTNIKNSTGAGVDELRRANVIKQRARRRNCFMILVTLVVGAIVVFVYFLQSPSMLSYNALKPSIEQSRPGVPDTDIVMQQMQNKRTIDSDHGNSYHPFSGS